MEKYSLTNFFYKLPGTVGRVFWGKNLLLHALAAALTFACVTSGLDWLYYTSSQTPSVQALAWPAVWIGYYLPIALPFSLLAVGATVKNWRLVNTGFAVGQAGALGWCVSSAYKFFTGRPGPMRAVQDISHVFSFGFDRGGIYAGWPSSHTTVAFAVSLALFTLYPKNKIVRYAALTYAAYIGLGVSVTIHWLSDFIAGTIVGTTVGIAVGESFYRKYAEQRKATAT